MEIWKDVVGTDGMIQVSNKGRVRSLLRGEPYILKATEDQKGYLRLSITLNRVKHYYKVHRLVANAFIENPNNLPQVNHIDGNKKNNNVENLEWITNIDNAHHAIENGLWENVFNASRKTNNKRKKAVIATKDNTILKFESISATERYFGSRHITAVIKGKRQHVKGWSFAYESEVM